MRFNRFFFFVIAAVLLAASCSVKENRVDCPVYVSVLLDRFYDNSLPDGMVIFDDADGHFSDNISFFPYLGVGYEYPANRHLSRCTVLSGIDRDKVDERSVTVPYGFQADMVWAYSETFSAEDDLYTIEAIPHKQYCQIKFRFDGTFIAPAPYPWHYRIFGECNGFDLYSFEPIEGELCCPVGPNNFGEYSCILPRQKENKLLMEIFVPNEDSELEGTTEYTIDLGKRFQNVGYDWTKEDLDDIVIKVGFASGGIEIEVVDWTHDYDDEVI